MLELHENFINGIESSILTDFISKKFKEKANKQLMSGNPGNWTHHKNDLTHQAIWYGDELYSYSNGTFNLSPVPIPTILKSIAEKISNKLGYDKDYFNSCYINKFISSGIGKHHDNDKIFRTGNKTWHEGYDIVVATLSVGASSNIKLYYKGVDLVEELDVPGNSLYIMPKGTQVDYKHEVKPCIGLRYSFTFRRIEK